MKKIFIFIFVLAALPLGFYFYRKSILPDSSEKIKEPAVVRATVYYSPTCGCCGNYISYLKRKGLETEAVKIVDIEGVKEKYKIPPEARSCHTTVIDNYVIEGHIPLEAIEKLLAEKPAIDGIALSGMPAGSPGMAGAKTAPFQIYNLRDGEKNGLFMSL